MMRTFKIISSLAFIALAATANADGDCQNQCENECNRFVTDVATGLECQVDDSHAGITKKHCKDHCKDFCTGTAVDCQKTCDDAWTTRVLISVLFSFYMDRQAPENIPTPIRYQESKEQFPSCAVLQCSVYYFEIGWS